MATLGELISEGSATTKLLLHLNGDATDSSGNGNNGTSSNITYSLANGRFGQGAGFNGTNSYISTGLDLKNITKTIIAWVKPTGTAFGVIVNQWYAPASWEFFLDASNHLSYASYNGSSVSSVTSTIVLSTGVWYMVAVSYNASNNLANIYINGAIAGSATLSVEESTSASNGMWLGRENGSTVYSPFNGSIDEVIISNTAWSATKIAKYYAMAKGRWATI